MLHNTRENSWTCPHCRTDETHLRCAAAGGCQGRLIDQVRQLGAAEACQRGQRSAQFQHAHKCTALDTRVAHSLLVAWISLRHYIHATLQLDIQKAACVAMVEARPPDKHC